MLSIGRLLGNAPATRALGDAASGMAEIFTVNKTRHMERGFDAQHAALTQHGVEFNARRLGRFDRFVNGLNRLPRPMLALGTLGLFIYAMVEPIGFARRMSGLSHVPEPLWWLLGAIVSFYFGARELHHFRAPPRHLPTDDAPRHQMSAWRAALPVSGSAPAPAPAPGSTAIDAASVANPALEDWRGGQG